MFSAHRKLKKLLIDKKYYIWNELNIEYLKKAIHLFLVFSFCAITVFAQESVPASGGNASGSNGSASFSLGQVFYATFTGTDASVIQGVQQPYEISTLTGIDIKSISLQYLVYPNPTVAVLNLEIQNYTDGFVYSLYDVNGKVLQTKNLENNVTSLTLKEYSNAVYFLKITQADKEIKSFKIIKIDEN